MLFGIKLDPIHFLNKIQKLCRLSCNGDQKKITNRIPYAVYFTVISSKQLAKYQRARERLSRLTLTSRYKCAYAPIPQLTIANHTANRFIQLLWRLHIFLLYASRWGGEEAAPAQVATIWNGTLPFRSINAIIISLQLNFKWQQPPGVEKWNPNASKLYHFQSFSTR